MDPLPPMRHMLFATLINSQNTPLRVLGRCGRGRGQMNVIRLWMRTREPGRRRWGGEDGTRRMSVRVWWNTMDEWWRHASPSGTPRDGKVQMASVRASLRLGYTSPAMFQVPESSPWLLFSVVRATSHTKTEGPWPFQSKELSLVERAETVQVHFTHPGEGLKAQRRLLQTNANILKNSWNRSPTITLVLPTQASNCYLI